MLDKAYGFLSGVRELKAFDQQQIVLGRIDAALVPQLFQHRPPLGRGNLFARQQLFKIPRAGPQINFRIIFNQRAGVAARRRANTAPGPSSA